MTEQRHDESGEYHHDPREGATHGQPDLTQERPPEPGGMGGKPPARGERVAKSPMPPTEE